MRFEPLYFKENLIIHNPEGHIGIVTLWTDRTKFYEKLKNLTAPIDDVAVIGNLFGNGIRELLRNLLYNPQINRLIITGRDRAGAGADLKAFFEKGFDLINDDYYSWEGKPVTAAKISTRDRIIDSMTKPYEFQYIQIFPTESIEETIEILKRLPVITTEINQERKSIPLPQSTMVTLPSNPRNFNILGNKTIDAWKELIFTISEFGHLVHLEKGNRKELQNVKVVIENPELDTRIFDYYWIKEQRVYDYQKEILSPVVSGSYTYGNRIRAYFGIDTLDFIIFKLKRNSEDRQCYVTLWDDKQDLNIDNTPCLVSLYFRKFQDKLTLTATFRTHNALDAWLYNVCGIKSILDYVSKETEIDAGAITIISHSITLDTNEIGRAKIVLEDRHFEVNMDARGYFTFEIDAASREIICKRYGQDHVLIKEYREHKIEKLQHILYKDHAISDINHAMYVGRQLALCEQSINKNSEMRL